MSRKKQPALEVPATLEEATALTADYVARDRQALLTSLHYERLIDGLKAERDSILARSAADQKLTFAAIKAWWERAAKTCCSFARGARPSWPGRRSACD